MDTGGCGVHLPGPKRASAATRPPGWPAEGRRSLGPEGRLSAGAVARAEANGRRPRRRSAERVQKSLGLWQEQSKQTQPAAVIYPREQPAALSVAELCRVSKCQHRHTRL